MRFHSISLATLKNSRYLGRATLLGVIVCAAGVGYSLRAARASGIPATGALVYSGTFTDATGAPLTTPQTVGVSIYDAQTGGNKLCERTSQPTTLDPAGRFQVAMPDSCAASAGTNSELWVEISLAGSALGRSKIGAVPYAVESNHTVTATNANHSTTADQANVAANVTGNITPTSVSVGGKTIIDSGGNWVGDAVGILGSVGYTNDAVVSVNATDTNAHWVPTADATMPYTMTVAPGDKVMLTGNAGIFPSGTSAASAIIYRLIPCYRANAQSAPALFGAHSFSEHDSSAGGSALNFHVIPFHGTITITTGGTFEFGVCLEHNSIQNPPAFLGGLAFTALRFR